MVARVANQVHGLATVPHLQLVRSIVDHVFCRSPGLAVCLHGMAGHRISSRLGKQVQEVTRWLFQVYEQRERIQSANPYLFALVKVFAKAHRFEKEHWGGKIEWVNEADVASELGKTAEQVVATGNKVIDAGLAELRTKTVHGSRLRYGAYGKWIGGAKRTTQVIRSVKPTKAGLLLYKKLKGL